MRYVSVAEGRKATGLRLVLTAGVPGPWSEAAKAILKVKGLTYLPVLQEAGGANPELQEWTGQGAAPVLAWNDERPRTESIDILYLAEKLGPTPQLIPDDVAERVQVHGLSREIIGKHGLGWERRLMLLAPMMGNDSTPEGTRRLGERYDFDAAEAAAAPHNVVRILRHLTALLAAQHAAGRRYFVGSGLTAVDIYWACFSNLFVPLPEDVCPMPKWLRDGYGTMGPIVSAALDPSLLAHRDFIFAEHIGLPMDFLAE